METGRKDGWICAWNENSRPREPESEAWILYISVDCGNEMSLYNFEIKRMEIGDVNAY